MIEITGVRLRQLEKQELTELCHQIIISFITAISFSRSHEDYKIGAALVPKMKSAAPIIIPVSPDEVSPMTGADII